MWYKKLARSFFLFVTMHVFDRQTDRRTDGQTAFSSLDRVCIPCSAVKIANLNKTNKIRAVLLIVDLSTYCIGQVGLALVLNVKV